MKQFFRVILLMLAGLYLSQPARAVSFRVVYDSSVTSQPNFATIQSAISVVTNTYHVLFTNSSSINLTCYWGAAGPFAGFPPSLGENITYEVGPYTYAQITNGLRTVRSSASDSNAVASLPASTVTNIWYVPRAQAKILGLITPANDTVVDGVITFANDVTYTFNPTNRTVPGAYDFIGAAEHEISEVMGRNYELNVSGRYIPYDLFRFTNSGVRCFDPYAVRPVYFSVDKGTNNLKTYFGDINSGDLQDWATSSLPDSYDAEVNDGVIAPLSPADLTAMDILGYNMPSFASSRLTVVNTNRAFRISFTNATSLPFSVFASTNLSLNFTNWTYLGAPAESPTGHFQFVDLLTNKLRFYRVRMP